MSFLLICTHLKSATVNEEWYATTICCCYTDV